MPDENTVRADQVKYSVFILQLFQVLLILLIHSV